MVLDLITKTIAGFGIAHPIAFFGLIAFLSLLVLLKSSDMVLFSISNYAKKFGISQYVVGILVVSIGTSLSELMASITGALRGEGGIVFGTVLGSSLFKIPCLGIVLLIAGVVAVKLKSMKGKEAFIPLVMVLLPGIFILNGTLSRIEGGILLAAYLGYTSMTWLKGGTLGKLRSVPIKFVWKEMAVFLGALVALLMSARWLIFSSMQVSEILGIPTFITGLVVIGIGASMPELSLQIKSVRQKKADLAFGNVLGAFIANSTLVLGIAALIRPIKMPFGEIASSFAFLVIGTIGVIFLLKMKKLNRTHGIILAGFYVVFLLAQFLF